MLKADEADNMDSDEQIEQKVSVYFQIPTHYFW